MPEAGTRRLCVYGATKNNVNNVNNNLFFLSLIYLLYNIYNIWYTLSMHRNMHTIDKRSVLDNNDIKTSSGPYPK